MDFLLWSTRNGYVQSPGYFHLRLLFSRGLCLLIEIIMDFSAFPGIATAGPVTAFVMLESELCIPYKTFAMLPITHMDISISYSKKYASDIPQRTYRFSQLVITNVSLSVLKKSLDHMFQASFQGADHGKHPDHWCE
jgi:hypothetical protein